METTLHRQLKERYGAGGVEVAVAGFRVDAVEAGGRLVEVQSGGLGRLRGKLGRLLEGREVRVVRPVVVAKWVVRRDRADGPDRSCRRSPRRGGAVDVFDDLVGLAGLLPHPNLRLDVLAVAVEEVRIPRRRWPGYAAVDRRLREVVGVAEIDTPGDLWGLLPNDLPDPFTTRDLADCLGRPADFAGRVAYCLGRSGAAEVLGKRGRHRLYGRAGSARPVGVDAVASGGQACYP